MIAEDARRLVISVNALVILDEAYMDFWDQSLINEVEKYSNLIIFRTASKAVGSAASDSQFVALQMKQFQEL